MMFLIGSAYGGVDISDYVDVGIRNHFTFHGIKLQNGHTYFASVRGKYFILWEFKSFMPDHNIVVFFTFVSSHYLTRSAAI